jgi:hypothetical protein
MKKKFVIILFSLLAFSKNVIKAQDSPLKTIRVLYYQASESKAFAESFSKLMEKIDEGNALLLGYKGMSDLMICHHSYNPYIKLKLFGKGKDKLDRAVNAASNNAELRFLRYSVQYSIPAILAYKSNMKEDKKILLDYLALAENKKADEDLFKRVKEFMLDCKDCTELEKAKIKLY